MIMNCADKPINTSRGRRKISLKSCRRSVIPIPNITTPKSIVICEVAHLKAAGNISAIAAKTMTSKAMFFDTTALIFSNAFMINAPH